MGSLVKWLGIVSTSTAVLASMMVLLVILDGWSRQTQTFMTVLYSVCLIGLFCSVVMMWKARYLMQNDYAAPYAHFTQAVADQCITNADWENVLKSWVAHTDFAGLSDQLLYLLVLFVVFLVVAVVFAIWSLMKLAKSAEVRQRV